ncbi:MAG TPA: M15 family metallopeptidase [Pilimelia sp.]|nr:M15 family metallopeptidase [Pilimelia sp.]
MYQRSDYPPPPAGVSRNNARERGWGPGWPACQRPKMVAVSRGGVTVHVHRDIAQLVATLLEATEQRYRYDIKAGQTWGFNCRAIRGTDVPSNHSWGLAVDINSLANPMGSTFKSDIPPAVVAMWWAAGFYWGGNYQNRPDAMHFEYIRRPSDVEASLMTARGYLTGAQPWTGRLLRLADPRMRGSDVAWVQTRLNAKGASPKVAVDGIWGPKTDEAFRAFQKRAGLVLDGVYGPKSHAALAK